MALVKCKECSKEISSQAKVCPNCGAKTEFAKMKSKDNKLTVLVILGLIVILLGLVFWFFNDEGTKRLIENTKANDNLKKEHLNTLESYNQAIENIHKKYGI